MATAVAILVYQWLTTYTLSSYRVSNIIIIFYTRGGSPHVVHFYIGAKVRFYDPVSILFHLVSSKIMSPKIKCCVFSSFLASFIRISNRRLKTRKMTTTKTKCSDMHAHTHTHTCGTYSLEFLSLSAHTIKSGIESKRNKNNTRKSSDREEENERNEEFIVRFLYLRAHVDFLSISV